MSRVIGTRRYSFALAVLDFLPVLLFGFSWLRVIQRGGGLPAVCGMALIFIGGLSKAVWKMQVCRTGEENEKNLKKKCVLGSDEKRLLIIEQIRMRLFDNVLFYIELTVDYRTDC